MEAVAEHINEMQKIYEEYGSIFDDLIKQYREYNPQRRVNYCENISQVVHFGLLFGLSL